MEYYPHAQHYVRPCEKWKNNSDTSLFIVYSSPRRVNHIKFFLIQKVHVEAQPQSNIQTRDTACSSSHHTGPPLTLLLSVEEGHHPPRLQRSVLVSLLDSSISVNSVVGHVSQTLVSAIRLCQLRCWFCIKKGPTLLQGMCLSLAGVTKFVFRQILS